MGETFMKIYSFSEDNIKKIQSVEQEVFEKYQNYIKDKFLPLFISKNYSLKIDLGWCNWRKNVYNQQKAIQMENGYGCFVGCTIQKDGKDLILQTNDEYEWEVANVSWQITAVEMYWFKKRIELFDDIPYDEINEDMRDLLEALDEVDNCK